MRRSFGWRLGAAFVGLGLASAALTAILVNLSFGQRFAGYLEDQQRLRQEQLVAALTESYERMGGWDVRDLEKLASLALMDGGTVRLLDAGGQEVWEPASTPGGRHMANLHREMMGGGPLGPERTLDVRVDGGVVGRAVVRVPQAGLLPHDVEFRNAVNRLLLFGGLAAAVVALGLGIALARKATAPARELTQAARALAGGDRSVRAGHDAPDEFGEMARAFNAMADTIEEEDRLRRGFAADVAHELRTPLAILRSQVEAMQDEVIAAGPHELESLHEEILRLSRVVADLETLASADAAGFSLQREPVGLDTVAGQAAADLRGAFEASEIALVTDLDPVEVLADRIRLRQIVDNLLSNALKFTPEGRTVRLAVRSEGDQAVITVADSGRGIPADELPHVFDRFFRGRDARAKGSGIGLTVVRELTEAHGGVAEVTSRLGEGTTFTIRLPLATSGPRTGFTGPSHRPSTVGVSRGGDR